MEPTSFLFPSSHCLRKDGAEHDCDLQLPKETPAENQMWVDSSPRPENKVLLATCWFCFTVLIIVCSDTFQVRLFD